MINNQIMPFLSGKENQVSSGSELKENPQKKGLFGFLFQSMQNEGDGEVKSDLTEGKEKLKEEPAETQNNKKAAGSLNNTLLNRERDAGREVEKKENLINTEIPDKPESPERAGEEKVNITDNKEGDNNPGQSLQAGQDENIPDDLKNSTDDFKGNEHKTGGATNTEELPDNSSLKTETETSGEKSNESNLLDSDKKTAVSEESSAKVQENKETLTGIGTGDDSKKPSGKFVIPEVSSTDEPQKETSGFTTEKKTTETGGDSLKKAEVKETQPGSGHRVNSENLAGKTEKTEVVSSGELHKTDVSPVSENKVSSSGAVAGVSNVSSGSEKERTDNNQASKSKTPEKPLPVHNFTNKAATEKNTTENPGAKTERLPDKQPILNSSDRFATGIHTDDKPKIPGGRNLNATPFNFRPPGFQYEPNSGQVMSEAEKELATLKKEQVNDLLRAARSGNLAEDGDRRIKINPVREYRDKKYRASLSNSTQSNPFKNISNQAGNYSSVLSGLNTEKQSEFIFSGMAEQDSTSASTSQADEENEIFWKNHTVDFSDSGEKGSNESQASGYVRLGQMPLSNIALRRNFMPGLTQSILQATGGGKSASKTWQKHNFVLENGKNIQVSAREIEGVLQLKLGSNHSELSKLLLQHQHEIREHLEKELDLKIDLQFTNDESGGMAEFFGDSSPSKNGRHGKTDRQHEKTASETVEQVLPKSVRKFGYNQMEWTA